MFERFHGVDKHANQLTINIVDSNGEAVKSTFCCKDFDKYLGSLTYKDAVAIEAGNQTFHLADKIEQQGATAIVVNPYDLKIISQSTRKTDKNDSQLLAQLLRQYMIKGD